MLITLITLEGQKYLVMWHTWHLILVSSDSAYPFVHFQSRNGQIMEGTGPGGKSRQLSPQWHSLALPRGPQCVLRPKRIHITSSKFRVCSEVFSQWNRPGKSPEGTIPFRCLYQTPFGMERQRFYSKLLPDDKAHHRISKAEPGYIKKPISAACIQYLILSVMIRESDPSNYSNFTLKCYLLVFTCCLLALSSSLLVKHNFNI